MIHGWYSLPCIALDQRLNVGSESPGMLGFHTFCSWAYPSMTQTYSLIAGSRMNQGA